MTRLALLLWVVSMTTSQPTLDLIVWHSVTTSIDDVHLTLRVARHRENRAWRVEAYDEATLPVRASAESLQGEEAPVVHDIWWRPLSPCDCEVIASLIGTAGVRAVRRRPLIVR